MTHPFYGLPQILHQRVTVRTGLDMAIDVPRLSLSQLSVNVTGEINLDLFVFHFGYVANEPSQICARGWS